MLILGSFPSVKSREAMFFYGHPQNRFWKVIATLYNEKIPTTVEEKKALLLRNHIAVWDVIAKCLPSTSPANAAWSFGRLLEEWRVIDEEK